jgi:glycosyltransferase involved in cell wall biosynthesis
MTASVSEPIRAPVSVCILAHNEEEVLERCLDSVSWAEEIVVVVDRKSRDGSEKIARERASHVEVRAYEGDIEQKSYCTTLATHEWVLIVDPDEVVSPSLGNEICSFLASQEQAAKGGGSATGCEINRLTFHLGRWLRHGDFYPDWKLRLYRKSQARWVGRNPHGRVVVIGQVERLENEIEHYSYRDLADQLDRIQFFSRESAAALHREGHPVRLADLVLRPPARFLRAYLLRRGFMDGVPGLIVAAATSFHVFLKYAKRWELARVKNRPVGEGSRRE